MPDPASEYSREPATIGFSEIEYEYKLDKKTGKIRKIKYNACDVLRYRWPGVKQYGDISKINWAEVPDFDLLTGGSPCQDLSIAGKRAGLEGERSGLFYEYMRAVREKQPKYFIWENVKGALSSQAGWDFAYVLNEMAEAGYSLWWQVLNAKDFGVPQNRERIFVVGTRDRPASEVFFEREGGAVNPGTDAQGDETAYCLQAGNDKHRGSYIKQLNNPTHSNNRLYSDNGISPALNTAQGGNRQPKIAVDTKRQGEPRFTENVATLGANDYKEPKSVLVDAKIRRLTPKECERLMGLPDDWLKYGIDEKGNQFEISDSQKYKLAGNGVVVNVVEEILKHIIL